MKILVDFFRLKCIILVSEPKNGQVAKTKVLKGYKT